tara:strand:- start:139 stop:291 length:153 start_codon:yes stop_codon:yes gene_type:complete
LIYEADQYKIYNNNFNLIVEIDSRKTTHQISSKQWDDFWKIVDDLDTWKW